MALIQDLVTGPAHIGGTIVVSPHPDDAALSLGGVLLRGGLPTPVSVWTVFGKSNYLRGRFMVGEEAAVTALRCEEECRFAALARVGLTVFPYLDACLRFGPSYEAIFSPYSPAQAPTELESLITARLTASAPCLVLLPMALGRHHDHVLARELFRAVTDRLRLRTGYYEDLPYAADMPAGEVPAEVRALGGRLRPRIVALGSLRAKLLGLRLYSSQLGAEELQKVENYAKVFAIGERIWLPNGKDSPSFTRS